MLQNSSDEEDSAVTQSSDEEDSAVTQSSDEEDSAVTQSSDEEDSAVTQSDDSTTRTTPAAYPTYPSGSILHSRNQERF